DYYTIEVVPASSNIWDDSSIGIKNGILNGIVSFEPRNTLKAPHGGDVYRNGTVGVTIMDLKTRVMNTYQTKNFNRRSVDLSTLNIPLTVGTQYAVSCIIEPNEYGWGMATLEKQFYT
ncbi:MAG: hypothetical protein LBV42_02790, partial [Methanobrevibacter sp.]|nr:hypothetical protein [Methanobrevibacter sp.]